MSLAKKQKMDPEVIQELAQLSSGCEDVIAFVETGFEQLMEKTIMWKLNNFFVGAVDDESSQHNFEIDIQEQSGKNGLKCTTWTFHLYPKLSPGGGLTYTVLQCSNKFKNKKDEKDAKNLLYSVKATIHGSRKDSHQSNVTTFLEVSEIFSIEKTSLGYILPKSGDLIIQITVTVVRKMPLIGAMSKEIADAGLGPVKTIDKPAIASFGKYLSSKEFSDVKIHSKDGKEFDAHKIILCAGNEVFNVMFKTGMTEATTGIIKLDDMSGAAVNFLLQFIYDGNILQFSVNGKTVDGVLRKSDESHDAVTAVETLITAEEALYVASKYMLKEVKAHIDRSFRRVCCEENATDLFKMSKIYSLECKDFLKNFIKGRPSLLDKLLEP